MQLDGAAGGGGAAKDGDGLPRALRRQALPRRAEEMRLKLIEALGGLAGEFDTVLVAMGFCGGSWESVYAPVRVVAPRADDCITILLNTDGAPHENLKEPGHIYIRDTDTGHYSLEGLRASVCERYGREQGLALFNKWFASYTHADIIDTGTYDSRAEDFLAQARRGAEIARCELRHVPAATLCSKSSSRATGTICSSSRRRARRLRAICSSRTRNKNDEGDDNGEYHRTAL